MSTAWSTASLTGLLGRSRPGRGLRPRWQGSWPPRRGGGAGCEPGHDRAAPMYRGGSRLPNSATGRGARNGPCRPGGRCEHDQLPAVDHPQGRHRPGPAPRPRPDRTAAGWWTRPARSTCGSTRSTRSTTCRSRTWMRHCSPTRRSSRGCASDPDLPGHVRIRWDALDHWFEEDEEVFVHPRSPYTRVDALRSSRHVRIELDDVVLAESTAPVLVFETGLSAALATSTAAAWSSITSSRRRRRPPAPTRAGPAAYWSARISGDLARGRRLVLRLPRPGSSCRSPGWWRSYDEKVDTFLDGVRQERPVTPFS